VAESKFTRKVREQLLASTTAGLSPTDACRTEGLWLNTVKSKGCGPAHSLT
jgi:hypothetical protein